MPDVSISQLRLLHEAISVGVRKLDVKCSELVADARPVKVAHFAGSLMAFFIEVTRGLGFSDERIVELLRRGLEVSPRVAPVETEEPS